MPAIYWQYLSLKKEKLFYLNVFTFLKEGKLLFGNLDCRALMNQRLCSYASYCMVQTQLVAKQ